MRVGGIANLSTKSIDARLVWALTGSTRYEAGKWRDYQRPDWIVNYLHRGEIQTRIGRGKVVPRPANTGMIYAPEVCYGERAEGSEVNHSFIVFELRGSTESVLRKLVGRSGHSLLLDPEGQLGSSLRELANLLQNRRPGYELAVHGRFLSLLGLLSMAPLVEAHVRNIGGGHLDVSHGGDLLKQVEHYVEAHLSEPVNVGDLARFLGKSESALWHTYPKVAGESPYQTIVRLKIDAAKRLLLSQGCSVKECSERLGFSSQFQFSRLFKRIEGVAPHYFLQRFSR